MFMGRMQRRWLLEPVIVVAVGRINMNGKGLIIAVVSVGVALGMLIVTLHQTTSAAIRDVRSDVANLREEVHRDI